MAETSTIFGFMKYVSATDILSDFKKTVDSHFVNSLKQIINLLVIMYWWFIPVYRLRDKIDLFLEMRVDYQTTNPFSKEEVMKYMHTLIEIQKNIQGRNEFNGQSTHFMIQDNANVLEYRINYLVDGMYQKKRAKF